MIVYDVALEVVRELQGGVLGGLRGRDPDLARQLLRAAQSTVLNISEARDARGKRSADKFSIALGEAREVRAALDLISVCGYGQRSAVAR